MELPADFVTRSRRLLGKEYDLLEAALHTDTPVSVRLNTAKNTPCPKEGAEQVPWCEVGYYLPNRLTFTFDPLFHAGTYYVQEASSMFLEQAVKTHISAPVRCLDLCAAPGGKSTHLINLLPEGSLLVCNEVIRNRSAVLAENIAKWGAPNVVVSNNDPKEIGRLTHYFDVIVADVPCSGEGMFRKDMGSRDEWSEANVQLCAARGRRIIHDIWDALKPGGLLIYSTCTYNTEENEENIEYIATELGAEALSIPVEPFWNICGTMKGDQPVYRFFPHRTKGEGFFLSVLRKAENGQPIQKIKQKNSKPDKNRLSIPATVYSWLSEPEKYHLTVYNEIAEAFPIEYKDDYSLLTDKLHIVSAGVRLGGIKGKDVIPHSALAFSTALNRGAFPQEEITWDEAIRFFRREVLSLPGSVEKGYVLLTHKGFPLGFVKQLGSRANNLYPQEWRIRTGYTPNEVKTLL